MSTSIEEKPRSWGHYVFAKTWELSCAAYGLQPDEVRMDRTVRKLTREECILSEERDRVELDRLLAQKS